MGEGKLSFTHTAAGMNFLGICFRRRAFVQEGREGLFILIVALCGSEVVIDQILQNRHICRCV